ncbi:hypothetical protein AHF37_05425 [Paragonimus kellicotti]|nr:hypothetical protein AHF37_05425 [Paragonimus kellicotti]
MGLTQSKSKTENPQNPADKPKTSVYAPDAESSGTSKRSAATSNNLGYLDSGRKIDVKRESPNDYLDILKPKKGKGRMEFNPYVPKTLTQKGYTKYKLMMSVASKQYETLIRHLQRERKLWEDPDFPTNDSSIGIPDMRGRLEWKRPRLILDCSVEQFLHHLQLLSEQAATDVEYSLPRLKNLEDSVITLGTRLTVDDLY